MSSLFTSSPPNYIRNKVLTKGIFPESLKFSIIKPLCKKGNKKDVSNYGPIFLLTSFSKMFAMQSRLLKYLQNKDISCREQ